MEDEWISARDVPGMLFRAGRRAAPGRELRGFLEAALVECRAKSAKVTLRGGQTSIEKDWTVPPEIWMRTAGFSQLDLAGSMFVNTGLRGGYRTVEVRGISFKRTQILDVFDLEHLASTGESSNLPTETTGPSALPENSSAETSTPPTTPRRGSKPGQKKRPTELRRVLLPLFRRHHDRLSDMSRKQKHDFVIKFWSDDSVSHCSDKTVDAHWSEYVNQRASEAIG